MDVSLNRPPPDTGGRDATPPVAPRSLIQQFETAVTPVQSPGHAFSSSLELPAQISPSAMAPTSAYIHATAPTQSLPSRSPSEVEHHAHFDLPPGDPKQDDALIFDIEHVPVENDPRDWSINKKTCVLYMVSIASLAPTLGASIYNPAFEQLRVELGASNTEIALSLSLFILFQGGWPVFWSSVAEVTGRKIIYLTSFSIFIVGTTVAGRSNSMTLLILMRLVQAIGSSAVLSVGAGSLADMYEKHERGAKMGLYYGVPLLGPSLGPLIGGILTNSFDWRATFYLIAAFGGVSLVAFIFFPDSWRKERSQLYQAAVQRSLRRSLARQEYDEKKRQKNLSKHESNRSTAATSKSATCVTTGTHTPNEQISTDEKTSKTPAQYAVLDPEMALPTVKPSHSRFRFRLPWARKQATIDDPEHVPVKLTIADINPLPAMYHVLKKPNNLLAVLCSGLLFACQYTISFTAAVTFAEAPWSYSPLKIGFVLLAFGGGNVLGSVLGGRYSDFILRRLKAKNAGVGEPEMRLRSTTNAMLLVVPSFMVYAWTCQERTNIAGPLVALTVAGFTIMVIYSSTLAYLVDSNPGRSSSAIACNSFFRGVFACVTSQVALPIRDAIGDGGLYTILSGVLVISCLGFCLVIKKGKQWRDPDWRWPIPGRQLSRQRTIHAREE